MLKVTATNFGVNPSDIQIDAYNGGNFIILNGEISVDTSFEGYKSLFTLEFTTEELPFTRSLPTAVYATVETDKGNYITITKAYVKDGNTISIRPVRAYDSYGSYKLKFFCAFAAINTAAEPTFQHCDNLVLEPTVGTMTDAECYLMKNDNWMLLVLKTGAIAFDETEGIIKANITTVLPDGQVFLFLLSVQTTRAQIMATFISRALLRMARLQYPETERQIPAPDHQKPLQKFSFYSTLKLIHHV